MIVGNALVYKTIGQILAQQAVRHPNCEAVTDAAHRFTYAQWEALTDQAAKALLSRGIKKGTHVGVYANDNAVTLCAYYAVWKIGAVLVPLCNSYQQAESTRCLIDADITHLLLGGGPSGLRREDFPARIDVIPLASQDDLNTLLLSGIAYGDAALRAAKNLVTADDPDTILFTSGTMERPKPVLTTHFSRVNVMLAQANVLEATEQDRFCSVLPMYHCFALTATVLAAMTAGACVCFPADRHGRTILETIQRECCTILTAVPTLFSVLLERYKQGRYDVSSLRAGLIGGSGFQQELYLDVCRTFNFDLLPSLGQTEATAGISSCGLHDPIDVRLRTLGRFFPGVEGCIKSTVTGSPVPAGTVGEICIRGYNVMQGYYKLPAATSYTIDKDGWLHTGDLGSLDSAGYLTYAGRKKEIIIRGGENISPSEIEALIKTDPNVEDVRVIGIPDRHYGETVCACVIAYTPMTEEHIRNLVRDKAAAFKVPQHVLFFDEFPRSPLGKIQLSALKAAALARLGITTGV